MRLNVSKKELIEALKKILLKGKWSSTSGLSSKSLGNYVLFRIYGEQLLVCNGDESTALIHAIDVDTEDGGEFVAEISTIEKYLPKMGDELSIIVDDTIVITSEGKKATIPIVVNHPYIGGIERLIHYWPIEYDAELTSILEFEKVKPEGAFQINGAILSDGISTCEIVNNGIYHLNLTCGDDIVNDKVILSSNKNISAYEEELVCSHIAGESATVCFSGPLHKFFGKGDMVNVFIGDEQPIVMLTNKSALIRANRMDV